MADPLPADVRKYLEDMSRLQRSPGEWPVAKARELLATYPKPLPQPVPNTKEQNIAFRKAWDARVEAGKRPS